MNIGIATGIKSRLWVIVIYALLLHVVVSCGPGYSGSETTTPTIEQRVDSLLAIMTLEEKIGQMTQVRHFYDIVPEDVASKFIGSVIHTQGPLPGSTIEEWQKKFRELQEIALSTRLGIPLLFGVDAVHGQNTFEGATIFPHNIGMGATGNADLVEEAAAITAIEVKATGLNWTFSPCIAIPYNEKWGRFYEAFSEDTELTSTLTRASVKGYQGGSDTITGIMATAKHYVAEGATDHGLEGGNTTVSLEEVSSRVLPPYRIAVEEGVGAVMVAFNKMLGKSMHANKQLVSDTLKGAMGFDGIVLTDWKGYSRFGGNAVINAGIDMVMAVDGDMDLFQQGLKEGVLQGEVPMSRIDDAVSRILRQKFRLGLFENPFPDAQWISKLGCQEHRDKARQAVRESLVLLKNESKALPISTQAKKIVVVGEHANNAGYQSGGWSVEWQGVDRSYQGATTILKGIQGLAEGTVVYDPNASGEHVDADYAIVVVGETPYAEFMGDIGEGLSEYTLTLSEKHQRYVEAYAGKGPKTVVLLISGRPLVITEQIELADAFIAAWLPGSEGDGIAEVLFGEYNFTGRLPHSWPASVEDFSGKYGPNYWNDSITPLYDFGYGLVY